MKKIIFLILIVVLTLGLFGCDKSTNEPQNETTKPENLENTITTKIYNIEGTDFCFEAPPTLKYEKLEYCDILFEDHDSLVAVCYNKKHQYSGGIGGIIEYLSPNVMKDISDYSTGNISDSSINITHSSSTKVSEINAIQFTANIPNGEWECYAYGYSFMLHETPVMIMGLVSSKAQDESEIMKINKLTNEIANSFYLNTKN